MTWKPIIDTKYFGIYTGAAGLITFVFGKTGKLRNAGLHLFVKRNQWLWGYEEEWYDGVHHCFGLGPLFLFVYSE